MYITNFKAVKHLQEWKRIQKIIALYNLFWNEHKYKLLNVKKSLKKEMDFDSFIKKLEEITKIAWTTKMLDLFLTIGYKQSGTYDRKINVIRVGIHEDNKLYLPYTIYHELIHFHIINHMKLKLPETEEEILCRAIFKLVFINDLIAQSHWKEFLTQQEQEKINKKAEEFQFL